MRATGKRWPGLGEPLSQHAPWVRVQHKPHESSLLPCCCACNAQSFSTCHFPSMRTRDWTGWGPPASASACSWHLRAPPCRSVRRRAAEACCWWGWVCKCGHSRSCQQPLPPLRHCCSLGMAAGFPISLHTRQVFRSPSYFGTDQDGPEATGLRVCVRWLVAWRVRCQEERGDKRTALPVCWPPGSSVRRAPKPCSASDFVAHTVQR